MINIVWNMGLGDAIACAAIAVKVSQKDNVTVPCWSHNEESVKSLFVNHSQIKVLAMDNDLWLQDKGALKARPDSKTILLGQYNRKVKQLPDEDFVQWFYRQAGMSMEEKEIYCPIKEQTKRFYSKNIYFPEIFIHDDASRGFNIKNIIGYRPNFEKEYSILYNIGPLMHAKEIHCIDSSFLHLAEALNVPGKKFYHKYARPDSTDFKYLKGWEVVSEEITK